MNVKFISKTTSPDFGDNAEALVIYCARVSSADQDNPEYERLIKYLIDHKHWSPFEMADMTVEIVTSRAISPQILRHRSFQFQEFSQRYAKAQGFENIELRLQGNSKQGSSEILEDTSLAGMVNFVVDTCEAAYNCLIDAGVSRETARSILPLSTQTKLYMKGSVRSWIHYLEIRCADDTQKEHRLIAEEIKKIFIEQFPTISKVLKWE